MHRLVAPVLKCVDMLRVRWNLIFIEVERRCMSLFVGAVIIFVDNSRLIDNSRELVDNVKDKR